MYQEFANVYDQLMDDFNYPAWADYYIGLLGEHGISATSEIVECGCGTGSLSIELARHGCQLIAGDISEDMLRVAADKARRAGQRIRFVRQDMRKLTVAHPADAVICACDGVNYLMDGTQVREFFNAAHAALRPGGVLAFDISSEYKLEHVLANDFFGEDRANVAYLWQNEYDPQRRIVAMHLTFFAREHGDIYRRFDEDQCQRAHSMNEITALLAECDFDHISVYGDRTHDLPRMDELRLHFSAVRR